MKRKKIKKITYEAEGCDFKLCVTQGDAEHQVEFYYITSKGEPISLGGFQTTDGKPINLRENWIYKYVRDTFETFEE